MAADEVGEIAAVLGTATATNLRMVPSSWGQTAAKIGLPEFA